MLGIRLDESTEHSANILHGSLLDNSFSTEQHMPDLSSRKEARPEEKIIVRQGQIELPFASAEKVSANKLEDILLNFDMGIYDAFVDGTFYVTLELASYYLDKIKEWNEINPSGAAYLGQKRVLLPDSSTGSVYSVPLIELFLKAGPEITAQELEQIIKEENLPFCAHNKNIKFIGEGDLEDAVLDFYDCLIVRGLADKLPKNFFESKVEGYKEYVKSSEARSKEEKEQLDNYIRLKWVSGDGRCLTLKGTKFLRKDENFRNICKTLKIRKPHRFIAVGMAAGLLVGSIIAATASNIAPNLEFFKMQNTFLENSEDLFYSGFGNQTCPVIWGNHIAWLDDANRGGGFGDWSDYPRDVVIKNLTSGQIKWFGGDQLYRSNLMAGGKYIAWKEAIMVQHDRGLQTIDDWIMTYCLENETLYNLSMRAPFSISDIFEDKLVYTDYGPICPPNAEINGTSQIFMYDITTGREKQITFNESAKRYPVFCKDILAWVDEPWTKTTSGDVSSKNRTLVVYNLNTNKTLATISVPHWTGYDIGEKYFVWSDVIQVPNGRGRNTWPLGRVWKMDLRTGEKTIIFSGETDENYLEPKTSNETIVWNAGWPHTIWPPFDGNNYCWDGISAYNGATGERGALADSKYPDGINSANVYKRTVVWSYKGDIYAKRLSDEDFKSLNNEMERRLDLLAKQWGASVPPHTHPIWAIAGSMLAGQAAGYAYYGAIMWRARNRCK